jgi:hypothetical protein
MELDELELWRRWGDLDDFDMELFEVLSPRDAEFRDTAGSPFTVEERVFLPESELLDASSDRNFVATGASSTAAASLESDRLRFSWGNPILLRPGEAQCGEIASILSSSAITLFPPRAEDQGSSRNMPCEIWSDARVLICQVEWRKLCDTSKVGATVVIGWGKGRKKGEEPQE